MRRSYDLLGWFLILIGKGPEAKRRETEEPLYLSWYKDARPWMNERKWLADGFNGVGHVYVSDRSQATRYTRELALKLTPKYDGSSGMEKRAGIERA